MVVVMGNTRQHNNQEVVTEKVSKNKADANPRTRVCVFVCLRPERETKSQRDIETESQRDKPTDRHLDGGRQTHG